MNQVTKHRGPDGTGIFCDSRVSLGHNLLAVIDKPENSGQPFISQDKNYLLVYNGEIYNHRQLRQELEQTGIKFFSQTDTEVLLNGLIKYGRDFLAKIDGMFAFAFYDLRQKTLFLARDASGMKPLYYYHQRDKFIFSSEIRGLLASSGILRKLDATASNIYFTLGYVPGEKTLIKNIFKLCPGQCLTYNLTTNKLTIDWFKIKDRFNNNGQDFDPSDFRKMIREAVLGHTIGLRPYGLYLSGGLDSTIILHELSGYNKELINTYTTRFATKESGLNVDADFAKRLTKQYNINHHELLITEDDFIKATEETIKTLEEPRYNFSVPAYWLLAKEASKEVVVVLCGDGGDELFLGYPRYLESAKIESRYNKYSATVLNFMYTLNHFKQGRLAFGQTLKPGNLLDRWAHLNRINPFLPKKIFKFSENFNTADLAAYIANQHYPQIAEPLPDQQNALAEFERMFWLADENLIRADKIMMHYSLEGRFPFLADKIIRYANGLSSKIKLKNNVLKYIVRESYKDILPDFIINKPKTGWYAPGVFWMNSGFGDFVKEVLKNEYYQPTSGLFDLKYVRGKYVDSVEQFTLANVKRFLPIFSFQIWAKTMGVSL